MKKIKDIILILLFFTIILFITNKVEATSISASPANPKKGQSVTITVSVYANTVDLTATVSGAGTSGTIRLVDGSITGSAKTFSKSITVTPTSVGTIRVSVSSSSNAVLNGTYVQNLVTSKNITVTNSTSNSGGNSSGGSSGGGYTGGSSSSGSYSTTTKPEDTEKSNDATLNGLAVKEGKITPEFKKDVKEYALTIPYEIEEINVNATTTDSKATVSVKGNKKLKEGENTVTVTVTAEDGSTSDYTIKVTRARVPIALKTLIIKYENQNGELVEIPLNPSFDFNTLEYTLEDLEYWVEKLSVEAAPNIEGAEVDIQGAESLQVGENTITINLKIMEDSKNLKEGEEPKEETISYTIKVNKKEKPTLIAKISNWFKETLANLPNWYDQNEEKVIIGALGVCNVALLGLSVYIVIDYNKYRDVIKKAKKVKKTKKINIAEENIIEETHKTSNDIKENSVDDEKNDKSKGGKHF